MLSTAASNALLKTLEEPPGHVVFVLATTDAQKVLPTIRSRTQHFEFRLLGPEVLSGLLEKVRQEAGLELGEAALESAVRRGRGSARDALSALDQVAAGGEVRDEVEALAEMADALAECDANRVLVEVAKASNAGHDAQRLAAELADYLRQGFLAVLSPDLVALTGQERERVEDAARRMGLPTLVKAMESLGRALVDMRDTPDPRVHLEATLIRLTHPELDDSATALLERVERLERALANGTAPRGREGSDGGPPEAASAGGTEEPPPTAKPSPATEGDLAPADPVHDAEASGPELARRALSGLGGKSEGKRTRGGGASARPGTQRESGSSPPASDASSPEGRGNAGSVHLSTAGAVPSAAASLQAVGSATLTFPSRDDLVEVWGDGLLASLPPKARARFRVGRFLSAEQGSVVFALPNETHRAYCESTLPDVEAALGSRFGTSVSLQLVVDEEETDDTTLRTAPNTPVGIRAPGATTANSTKRSAPKVSNPDPTSQDIDFLDPEVFEAETLPAGEGPTPEERIKLAFPGAEEV